MADYLRRRISEGRGVHVLHDVRPEGGHLLGVVTRSAARVLRYLCRRVWTGDRRLAVGMCRR